MGRALLKHDSSVGNSTSLSPFEACLLNVASTLDRPLSLAMLHAAETGLQEGLTIQDVISVAQRIGLQAGYGARRLNAFDDTAVG